LFFLAQNIPQSFAEVLIVPVILTFAGIFIYALGWNQERQGKRAPWKWAGMLPLLLGVWLGLRDYQFVQSTFVKLALKGQKKVYYAHYVSLFLPLLTAVGLVAWNFVDRAMKRGPIKQTEADVQSSPT
jgi:hypothetical protein